LNPPPTIEHVEDFAALGETEEIFTLEIERQDRKERKRRKAKTAKERKIRNKLMTTFPPL
jgi:hypothetical protein